MLISKPIIKIINWWQQNYNIKQTTFQKTPIEKYHYIFLIDTIYKNYVMIEVDLVMFMRIIQEITQTNGYTLKLYQMCLI